tara:strand:+ start:240 stop:1691 length:1452 start_codon:yes stop_codon:yes gene_type:complete
VAPTNVVDTPAAEGEGTTDALVQEQGADAPTARSRIHTDAIARMGTDLMDYLSECLKHHGYEDATIKNIFSHYQNKNLGNLGSGIRKWLRYCKDENREHQKIVWHNPSSVDVTNWMSSKAHGPGKSTAASTSRNYKRGLAMLLTMVNNKVPSDLLPSVEINLTDMAESGRKVSLSLSSGVSAKKTNRYDQSHFLHTHYIYDFYRANTLNTSLSKIKRKQWLRMKAIVLLRIDSMRRSGGLSRIPMKHLKLSTNGKCLEFKINMPKGAHQCLTTNKSTKRITNKGLSSTLKVFSSNDRNKDCCVVQAVKDYMEATKADRDEAYTKGVTVKGSTTEATADYLFISVSRCKRNIKNGMESHDKDGTLTFRKVSDETIANTVKDFLKSHLFEFIPPNLRTKELLSVTPHVLRHWASSNFAFRLNLKKGEESPLKEYFLNLAGWTNDTEFFRTYNILPPNTKSNARSITNLARVAERLRSTSVPATPV